MNFDVSSFHISFSKYWRENSNDSTANLLRFLGQNVSALDLKAPIFTEKRLVEPNAIGKNINQLAKQYKLNYLTGNLNQQDSNAIAKRYVEIENSLKDFYKSYEILLQELLIAMKILNSQI